MYKPLELPINLPKLEEEILEYWQAEKIFARVQEKNKDGKPFVFFEGPPTANAKPGIHHVEARVFKDLIPRYQSMKGRFVDRKAGWDTQGLPVELQIEKKLGLKNKKEIEAYGIDKFNAECKQNVWEFKGDWEKLTERIGFWLDLDNPYITYSNEYIQSVWSIIATVAEKKDEFDRPMLYEGHKVVPFCTRCGTALSSHEVAQGYKNVTEPSVYLKFALTESAINQLIEKMQNAKCKMQNDGNFFITSWTTTPWTLPGNVALAVGADLTYVVVKLSTDEKLIIVENLAKEVIAQIGEEYSEIARIKGSEMIGLQYEPLFPGVIKDNGNAFKVYDANFVTTEDGTGVVHTAVMYGEDDYNLGTEVGLPKQHTVGEDGKFFPELGVELSGRYVKDKGTEAIIVHLLEQNGNLLCTKEYTHDYPYCWRCDTALLYYARNSWFIRMSSLREKLILEGNKVNWEPKTIKSGRMGEWLANIKDWAISRDRYWGTPLPIWRCEADHITTAKSIDDLYQKSAKRNKIYFMRHGEATSNVEKFYSCYPELKESHLTDAGIARVKTAAKNIGKIDVIYASDLDRIKETAKIMSEQTGAKIIFDKRLREINFGKLNGEKNINYLTNNFEKLTKSYPVGESAEDVRARMLSAINEINQTHEDLNILIISHGDPLYIAQSAIKGVWDESMFDAWYPEYGTPYEVDVKDMPFAELGVVDLHKPFIDSVKLICTQCGKSATRVPEVADVWFDSGSMPFSQWGFPHADGSSEKLVQHYPADYISEAIDQTRGWFYTLLAIAVLMDKEAPYKNVICLGHVLDEHGKKMSKSKGNVIDPWELINKYGVDALRFYFYNVNPPGEPKLFAEKDLLSTQRRIIMLLLNVYSYFVTYANDSGWKPDRDNGSGTMGQGNILDRWIMARLNEVTALVTKSLDKYNVLSASRNLEGLIDDLSTWYLRRSRSRFSETNEHGDRNDAFQTLYDVLLTLSKLMAPLTPFTAEIVHKGLVGESVHLSNWPEKTAFDPSVIDKMIKLRKVITNGLDGRMQCGIKVRQELGKYFISPNIEELGSEYLEILEAELNMYNRIPEPTEKTDFICVGEGDSYIGIDPTITPELEARGMMREIVRYVQDWRKKSGLTVGDKVHVIWFSGDEILNSLLGNPENIKSLSIATKSTWEEVKNNAMEKSNINGHIISIEISKEG